MPSVPSVLEIRRFLDKPVAAINRKRFYPRSNVHVDLVLLALVSKSVVVGRAVWRLVESRFYEEAFGLTRTLMDIYLTVRYIANQDSLSRAEKFVNFYARDYVGCVEILQKYYASTPVTR